MSGGESGTNTTPGAGLVVFAAGGTGGHLFPALAVADALRQARADIEIAFFCTTRPIDAQILDPTPWTRVAQPVTAPPKAPWRWPGFARRWRASHGLCRQAWAQRAPSVVVGTGGFASLPPARVARRQGVPIALLNPDAIPGKANRWLGRNADAVFVQWESSVAHFPHAGLVRATGCPIRVAFLAGDRDAAAGRLGLDPGRKTLLITGASQGARTVNEAVLRLLAGGVQWEGWQVLHLTGTHEYERIRSAYRDVQVPSRVLAFCDAMADAVFAADLVVSRAGASTLAELTAVGRAAVLLPYPFHRDNHQARNAAELAERGAATVVTDRIDAEQNARQLRPALETLMQEAAARERMARASHGLGRREAATEVAEALLQLAGL